MKWFLSVALIGIITPIFSQEEVDSIHYVSYIGARFDNNPEETVNEFYSITESDSLVSYLYGSTLLRLVKEKDVDTLVVAIAYELGQSLILWADFDRAKLQFEKLIKYSQDKFLPEGISFGYKGLGDVEQNSASYEEAIKYFLLAEKGWKQSGNEKRLAYLYNNIGVCYRKQGNNYGALKYYIAALELLKKIQDNRAVAVISNNVGNIYFDQGEVDKAIKYHNLVFKAGKELKNDYLIATALNNIGLVWDKRGDRLKALSYFKRALILSRDVVDKETKLLSLTNLGESYIDHQQYDSARQYLNQALSLSRTQRDPESETFALIGLGKVFKALNQNLVSKEYLIQGLRLAEETSQGVNTSEANRLLGEVEQKLGNYQSSISYLKKYHLIHDSLKYIASQNNLELLKAEYEFKVEHEKSNAEIEFLASQNEVQELQLSKRNLLLTISIVVFVAILIIGYLIYHQRLVNKRKEANDLKQKLLRVQLNPHFMFNSLNAIQNLVYKNADKQKTADYLARFSHLTRQILELNQHDFIILEDELKFIENYLTIQQIRFDQPFEYKIELEDSLIDKTSILIPPMITQPFLENAIEHGIINKNENGEIKLMISKDENYLFIKIEDNGVGREAAAFEKRTKKHRSMATQITLDRLENLKKSFRKQADMSIEDIVRNQLVLGTRVYFKLPLKVET